MSQQTAASVACIDNRAGRHPASDPRAQASIRRAPRSTGRNRQVSRASAGVLRGRHKLETDRSSLRQTTA